MNVTAPPSAAWADTLLQSFARAGYVHAEPDILQPADPFLDLSGEDIRKSLYLTTDATGEDLCLRPRLRNDGQRLRPLAPDDLCLPFAVAAVEGENAGAARQPQHIAEIVGLVTVERDA